MKRIQCGEFVGGYLGDTLGEYDRCDRSKFWILRQSTGYKQQATVNCHL